MKKFFLLAVAIAAMASCAKEPAIEEVQDDNVIRLSTNIGPQTRASFTGDEGQNTQFVSGKTIYVEAYETGQSTAYSTGTYTTGAAGSMTGGLYYPANGSNVDICAFYGITGSNAVAMTLQQMQNTVANYQICDVMYAEKLENKAKGSTHALTFHHAFTKIEVNLSPGDGVTADDISNKVTLVQINNVVRHASLSVTNGVVTGSPMGGASAGNIVITGSNKASQAGIIVPQTVAASTTFVTITYNGNNYTYDLGSATTFAAGYVYTYGFTLSTAGIQLSSSAITNWTSGVGDTANITL